MAPGEPEENDDQIDVEGVSFLYDKRFEPLFSRLVIDVKTHFGEAYLTAYISHSRARGCM